MDKNVKMDYLVFLEKEIEYLRKIPVEKIPYLVSGISRNLHKGSRVITTGMGKAGQIAHTFATTLSSTGVPSFFLHPSEAQHGDLGIVCPGDIIVVFSNSGKTREVLEVVGLINELGYGNLIYGIIGKHGSELSLECNESIEFGEVEEICPLGLTPTTSTTCMSVICDLIVVGLMKQNMFTRLEYSKRHHGGYLGEKSKN